MTPNLVLLGPRGSGKTTVGRELATLRGLPLIDLDAAIVAEAGRSIADIFADEGEAGFRRREADALRVACGQDCILATGGGVIVTPANVELLRSLACPRVLLIADAATLHARIVADAATAANRPALTSLGGVAEIEHLLSIRRPLYDAVATRTIDVSRITPAEAIELMPI